VTRPRQGDVWTYEYLWRHEHEAGAEHGRKPRPTALVAIAVGKDGRTNLFFLPITSTEPGADRLAMEVPEIECKRERSGFGHAHVDDAGQIQPRHSGNVIPP